MREEKTCHELCWDENKGVEILRFSIFVRTIYDIYEYIYETVYLWPHVKYNLLWIHTDESRNYWAVKSPMSNEKKIYSGI